jgi:hypothetical protein
MSCKVTCWKGFVLVKVVSHSMYLMNASEEDLQRRLFRIATVEVRSGSRNVVEVA